MAEYKKAGLIIDNLLNNDYQNHINKIYGIEQSNSQGKVGYVIAKDFYLISQPENKKINHSLTHGELEEIISNPDSNITIIHFKNINKEDFKDLIKDVSWLNLNKRVNQGYDANIPLGDFYTYLDERQQFLTEYFNPKRLDHYESKDKLDSIHAKYSISSGQIVLEDDIEKIFAMQKKGIFFIPFKLTNQY